MHRRALLFSFIGLTGMTAITQSAKAHGGGLDKYGCHTNRKTGEYHCHRSPAVTSKPAPQSAPVSVYETPNPQPVERAGPAYKVMSIQTALNALGYDAGPIDGIAGAATTIALRGFQRTEGLNITAELDDEAVFQLVQALSRQAAA